MQVVVLLAFGRVAFGIHISSTAWAAIPVALAGCLCFLAMGFAIGSVVANPETGDAVSNVITNPMMFLSGTFFPVAAMPAFVQAIAKVLPLYYLANGLRDTIVRGLRAHDVCPGSGYCWRVTAVLVAHRDADVPVGASSVERQEECSDATNNVIVGGGLAGGMVAQEYREQGGDGSRAHRRPRAAPAVPPAAADQGVPARREAGRGGVHAPGGVVEGADVEVRTGHRRDRARRRRPHASTLDAARRSSTAGSCWPPARRRARCPAPRDPHDRRLADGRRAARRGTGHLGVIGGGFIGVEAAASARMKGWDVTMAVPRASSGSTCSAPRSALLPAPPGAHGVTVHTGTKELPDGTYDVRAGRDRRHAEHRAGEGGRAGRRERRPAPTSTCGPAPDVWAVGDIADYQSVVHGRRIRIEHWDVALNQGAYVGRSWAGKEDGPYAVVPYFFSDLGDWTWFEYVGPGRGDASTCADRWTPTTSSRTTLDDGGPGDGLPGRQPLRRGRRRQGPDHRAPAAPAPDE